MITVIDEHGVKKEFSHKKGENLLDFLRKKGYPISANCYGNGTCGKCKVRLIKGTVEGALHDENGYILSCKSTVTGDIEVELTTSYGLGLNEIEWAKIKGEKNGLGIALDVGTTTLGACLINLKNGEVLGKTSCLNPQSAYGADVLNRIKACADGNLSALQDLILEKTRHIIEFLAKNRPIDELIVSANTTMLHVFLGVNPQPIGVYPFTPKFTDSKILDGKTLNLPVKTVRLLPSASAYIGSDVMAGVLACNLNKSSKTQLLIDVGTNGEILLSHEGRFYATSTATGPALEGACIECGTGGVSGAINKVFVENGELKYLTVDGALPKGICGSGLIDLIAILLVEGLVDEYGSMQENPSSPLNRLLQGDRFYLTDSVYLSQRDIRQYQLAKSAICAGIETLLKEKGVSLEQIQTTYIAGGLGFFMSVENAVTSGLLPKALLKTVKTVGNASLAGARLCLISDECKKQIERIASDTQIIELSFSTLFQELYVNKMTF